MVHLFEEKITVQNRHALFVGENISSHTTPYAVDFPPILLNNFTVDPLPPSLTPTNQPQTLGC